MKKYCLLFSLIAGVLVGCAGSLTRPSESFDSVSGGNADSLSLAISSVEVPSFDSSIFRRIRLFRSSRRAEEVTNTSKRRILSC